MSITLHELADRLREQYTPLGAKLEVTFGVAGLVQSATLVGRVEHGAHGLSGACYCPAPTRTKIV